MTIHWCFWITALVLIVIGVGLFVRNFMSTAVTMQLKNILKSQAEAFMKGSTQFKKGTYGFSFNKQGAITVLSVDAEERRSSNGSQSFDQR